MKKFYSILAVVAMTTVANAQNLVQNPSFENWTKNKPDNWIVNRLSFEKSDVIIHEGASAIAITSKKDTSTLGATDIPVTEGKTYVFSGWYLDNDNKAEFKYWGQWRTNSALLDKEDSMQKGSASTDSPEWKQFQIEVIAPATATFARLSLRTYKQNNEFGGKIYFDDISFVEKSSLSINDTNSLEKSVKFNTIVDDKLTIFTTEKVTVNIYSLEGKLVSSNRISNGESINFSGVQKGNYIISIDNGKSKISKKIIKK